MEKKLFMVNTYEMKLEGCKTHMAEMLGTCFPQNEVVRYRAVDIGVNIPFKKTENSEKEEYVEMLTGTLYHKEGDKFVSEDSLVSFTRIIDYDADLFADLCENRPLLLTRIAMKSIYRHNRKLDRKEKNAISSEEKCNKVLKKLERKYKNKLEGRK